MPEAKADGQNRLEEHLMRFVSIRARLILLAVLLLAILAVASAL